jgi:hypothetical protein
MDPEVLREAVEHAGIAAAGLGLLAGLAFSFNPVAMASIPVSLAYVTKARQKEQAVRVHYERAELDTVQIKDALGAVGFTVIEARE